MGSAARKAKTDNHPASKAAKLELRRHILEHVSPARVFDGFCGTGEMYRGVWHEAEDYVGCDERPWARTHPPRFVADNRRVMRAIDLHAFNVFDLDAYGSPWEQVTILAARRSWAPGEKGGLVITDGSSLNLRWGGVPHAVAKLAGMASAQGVPSTAGIPELQALALVGFVRRAAVKVLQMWQAEGKSAANVCYTALVFEGLPAC
jgi:hypothetical protein